MTAVPLLAGVIVGGIIASGVIIAATDMIRGDAPTEAAGPPLYVEETTTAGVGQIYEGEFEHFVGGGVAVFDCNSDLYPDMFIADKPGSSSTRAKRMDSSSVAGPAR